MNCTIRLLPCSKYENEIMESWLEDLALQGLVLENISYGLAKFRKQEPQKLRYRLSVIPGEKWDVYEEVAGKDQLIEICEASGWKFICQRGHFGIFMTADETVEELHTEPELQYLDLKDSIDWRALMWHGIWFFIVFTDLLDLISLNKYSAAFGTQHLLLIAVMTLIMICASFLALRNLVCPLMLYRKLKKEGIQHKRVSWQRKAMCYRCTFILFVIIYAIGFGYAFNYFIQKTATLV